jgi:hypothetical protein
MRVYVVRKWPLRDRSRFVCWNTTRVSLWLLCNLHCMQSANWVCVQAEIKWSPLIAEGDVERVWASFLHSRRNQRELQLRGYRCRKQQCGWFCVSVWCFLVIYVCNQGEHYETPCILD